MATEICATDGPHAGTRFKYLNGELHCDTGPAVVSEDGTLMFFHKGVLHRNFGLPALILGTGDCFYFQRGKLGGRGVIAILSSGEVVETLDGFMPVALANILARFRRIIKFNDAKIGYWTPAIFAEAGLGEEQPLS